MIGVYQEGLHLHMANVAVLDFNGWAQTIEEMLNTPKDEMSEEEYLHYGTIKGLFKKLTLHGAGKDEVVIIPLPFDMQS